MDKNILNEINRFREISGLNVIEEQFGKETIETVIKLDNKLNSNEFEQAKKGLEIIIIVNNNLNKAKTIKCGETKTVRESGIKIELDLNCEQSEITMLTKVPAVAKMAQGTSQTPVVIMLSQTSVTAMNTLDIKINDSDPARFKINTTVADLIAEKEIEPITISKENKFDLNSGVDLDTPDGGEKIHVKTGKKGYATNSPYQGKIYYIGRGVSKDSTIANSQAYHNLTMDYKRELYDNATGEFKLRKRTRS